MKIKLQTVNESGDGFNERMIDCGDGDVGEQLMSFFAQTFAEPKGATTAPNLPKIPTAPQPNQTMIQSDAEGNPILDNPPEGWDSNADTWAIAQWAYIDAMHRLLITNCQPPEGWDETTARFFVEKLGERWGPPCFDEPIPADVDWGRLAREYNSL